jgi:hypothetical protein
MEIFNGPGALWKDLYSSFSGGRTVTFPSCDRYTTIKGVNHCTVTSLSCDRYTTIKGVHNSLFGRDHTLFGRVHPILGRATLATEET